MNASFSIVGQGAGCNLPIAMTGWVFDTSYSYIEVTPICPGFQTGCTATGPTTINGVVSVRYYRDYDFCNTNCNNYSLVYDGCCRNGTITSGAANNGMFSNVTQINTTLMPCNSSPAFTNPPVPYLCAGQSFTFNQGAFDSDGDSLVYSLGDCFRDQGQIVNYNGGYSAGSPLGTGWNVSINSQTGDVTMTPSPNGPTEVGVICVYVTEYRNGVQIGQVVRDMQITVIACPNNNTLPNLANAAGTTSPFVNLSPGATANGLTVTACACQELCFDIPVTDPDQTQNTIMYWDRGIGDGTFTDVLSPNFPADTVFSNGPGNPPTARFCWVPIDAGTYSFLLTLQDDGCPIIGQNQYTVVVNVITCSLDPVALTDRQSCYEIEFTGIPCGGDPPFVYTWFGDGGLGGSGETFSHTYPATGTYEYTLTITDSSGVSSSITDSIEVGNTAVVDGGPDITVCSGQVGTIGTAALPGYSYQWTSPLGQGWNGPANPATAQPTVSYLNGTTSPVVLEYYVAATDPLGCVAMDTVRVTFEPEVSAFFAIDPPNGSICLGDTVTLTYGDPPPPGAQFIWNMDGGIGTSAGPGPHNITWSTPGPKFVSLVVDAGTCQSDTVTRIIDVKPIPSSTFILADTVCVDEFTQMIYTGTGTSAATYTWDVGNANPSSVTGSGPHDVSWSSTGFQQVSLSVEENGCVGPTVTNTTFVAPIPENDFLLADTVCVGEFTTVTYLGTPSATADYDWNFGDAVGLFGPGAGPHILSWNTPGTRNICLQVSEGDCSSPVRCRTVVVLKQPAVLIDPVADQCLPGNSFSFNVVGDPADVYLWDFGASAVPPTFSGPVPPPVTYQSAGSKTVSLIVIAGGCQALDTAQVSFEVVAEPSADFIATTTGLCGSQSVGFSYNGPFPNASQTFVWDFGADAVPGSFVGVNPPTVTYTNGGVKDVTLTVTDGPCTVTSLQQVNVNPGPTVSAGQDVEFCEGDGGVGLDASVFGGTAPYTYEWFCDRSPNCGFDSVNIEDPRVNPDVLSPTEPVTFYFQVTDANGCTSNLDSVVVTVKAKPKVDAGPDQTRCPKEPGDFLQGGIAADNQAPGPFTFEWSPPLGLADPSKPDTYAFPDTTTIYTLTATSANGCTSEATTVDTTSSMTYAVLPKPEAFAGPDTGLCIGESIQLEGFASGAGPDYTYVWTGSPSGSIDDPSSPTPNVSPTQTTIYTLTVISGGCESDGDTVRVEVDTKPTVAPGTDESVCLFEPFELDARAAGDPRASSYSYQWLPTDGLSDDTIANPTATPDQTTTYSVVATSEFGCSSDTGRITLTLKPTPVVELLQADTSICGNEVLTLTAAHDFMGTGASDEVNYRWLPDDYAFTALADSIVEVIPTRSGYLIVETVVSSGDCPTRDSVFVSVAPAIEAIATADTTRICEGASTQVFAEGGQGNATFEWVPALGVSDPTSPEPIVSPDTTTTYVVRISEGICVGTDTVVIAVNPSPEAAYFSSITEGCDELEVSFMQDAPGAIAYVWDFGDGSELSNEPNPVHMYEQPGVYNVSFTAIGIGGCEEVVSNGAVEVFPPAVASFVAVPEAPAELPVGTQVIFTDQSEEASRWLWDFGDGNMSTEQNPAHLYSQVGTYSVSLTVTDEQGCSSTQEYGTYTVFLPELLLQNIFTPNGDGVNDELQFQYPGDEPFNLVVFDRWGRQVFTADSPNDSWNGILDNGSAAKEGVYLYTLIIGEQQFSGTITLMR